MILNYNENNINIITFDGEIYFKLADLLNLGIDNFPVESVKLHSLNVSGEQEVYISEFDLPVLKELGYQNVATFAQWYIDNAFEGIVSQIPPVDRYFAIQKQIQKLSMFIESEAVAEI